MWNWVERLLGFEQWEDDNGMDTFILDPNSDFSTFVDDKLKIQAVFTNPAVLKVFKLQCDMFSLGRVYVYQNGKPLDSDPFLNLISNPNLFQQKSQFLWDYMFYKMIGNAYCYVDSDNPNSGTNRMYFLDNSKIMFPDAMRVYKDKLILSKAAEKIINEIPVTYRYADGTSIVIPWGRITHITDLTNGAGDWFKGRSSIDAMYAIISNSKASLKSKNINVRYAGKFMVAGKADPNNISQQMMGDDEKQSIEQKMNGRKSVHAVKSMVDIKRFVEQASILEELDKSYWNDYFKLGSMFGIPRDVLEVSLEGATYENQEKARGAHVDYTLQPAGDQLTGAYNKRFGYIDRQITMSWNHLPFTQVFAKDKAETEKSKSQALVNLVKLGIKIEEINSTLGTEYTFIDYEAAKSIPFVGVPTPKANGQTDTSGEQVA